MIDFVGDLVNAFLCLYLAGPGLQYLCGDAKSLEETTFPAGVAGETASFDAVIGVELVSQLDTEESAAKQHIKKTTRSQCSIKKLNYQTGNVASPMKQKK